MMTKTKNDGNQLCTQVKETSEKLERNLNEEQQGTPNQTLQKYDDTDAEW